MREKCFLEAEIARNIDSYRASRFFTCNAHLSRVLHSYQMLDLYLYLLIGTETGDDPFGCHNEAGRQLLSLGTSFAAWREHNYLIFPLFHELRVL